MPLSPHEIRVLSLAMARGHQAGRSVQSREVDEVKAYADRLFTALFTGCVLAGYHESLAQIRADPARGMRVLLRLADAPDLWQQWNRPSRRGSGSAMNRTPRPLTCAAMRHRPTAHGPPRHRGVARSATSA
jgi:hypothetical protein